MFRLRDRATERVLDARILPAMRQLAHARVELDRVAAAQVVDRLEAEQHEIARRLEADGAELLETRERDELDTPFARDRAARAARELGGIERSDVAQLEARGAQRVTFG